MSISNLINGSVLNNSYKLNMSPETCIGNIILDQTVPNNSIYPIQLSSIDVEGDSYELDSGDNTKINILKSGVYILNSTTTFATNSAFDRGFFVLYDGVNIAHQSLPATATQQDRMNITALFYSDGNGESVQINVFQNSGGPLAGASSSGLNRLIIKRLN